MSSDALIDFISRFTFTAITYLAWVLLGEIIAAHQHGIVCRSQQLQRFLHLPTCIHIFSEADTAINQDDIKFAAISLFFTALFFSLGMLGILIEGPTSALSRPWLVCGMFVLIATPLMVLWLRLALTCRRRQRSRSAVAWDIEDVGTDDPEVARDAGGDENTALLPSANASKIGKTHKVEDDELRHDVPSKKEAGTAGKSSRGGGHKNTYVTRVSWDNSELPFAFMF